MGFEKLFEQVERRAVKHRVGSRQDTIGKLHKLFIQKFLGNFDRRHRDEIESLVKRVFQYKISTGFGIR